MPLSTSRTWPGGARAALVACVVVTAAACDQPLSPSAPSAAPSGGAGSDATFTAQAKPLSMSLDQSVLSPAWAGGSCTLSRRGRGLAYKFTGQGEPLAAIEASLIRIVNGNPAGVIGVSVADDVSKNGAYRTGWTVSAAAQPGTGVVCQVVRAGAVVAGSAVAGEVLAMSRPFSLP